MKKFILALNVFALLGCAYAVDVISATDLAANIAADPAGSYTLTSNIDCSDWVSVILFVLQFKQIPINLSRLEFRSFLLELVE